jgi:D-aspartate ligase
MAVAELPQSLKDRFLTSVSHPSLISTMTDKWRFAEMLDHLGVPHPETKKVDSLEDMLALPEACYEGMFLKPLHSQEFSTRFGVKAFQVDSKSQALETMRKVGNGRGVFPILLQSYIPGPPTNHFFIDGFVDRDRRISALFARRRLRMFPQLFGNSTLMETVPLSQVRGAVATIERMWSALDYRGIFSAEFKYHEDRGEFMIVEVNARPWWYIEFAARCGINVSHMAYRDAQNLPVEPVTSYPIGKRCVYMVNDLAAYHLTDPGLGGFLRWINSCKGAERAIFCWDDPRPGFLADVRTIGRLARGKHSR